MSRSLPEKTCVACGRRMTWRKKWARNWESVRYCSDACRSRGVKQNDRRYESAIVDALQQRARGASICPSEIARALHDQSWREALEPVRAAARRLVADGKLVITQRGKVIDPSHAKGPIRLRLLDQ